MARKKSLSITLEEIAREAGVSVTTVSRSLRHSRSINPETRAKILSLAFELGYQGSSRKGVKKRKAHTELGVLLVPNAQFRGFYATMQLLRGITSQADVEDCIIRIEEINRRFYGHMNREDDMPRMVRSGAVDAVLTIGSHYAQDIEFMRTRIPVISLSRRYVEIDSIEAKNDEAGKLITGHFIEMGHRKLLWIREFEFFRAFEFFNQMREAGFIQECVLRGMSVREDMFMKLPSDNVNDLFVKNLLKKITAGVTGVLCANDRVARIIFRVLTENGVKVPEDVSIAGVDAEPEKVGDRTLTSYEMDFVEMGRASVRASIQRIREPVMPSTAYLIPGRFVSGQTVKKIN